MTVPQFPNPEDATLLVDELQEAEAQHEGDVSDAPAGMRQKLKEMSARIRELEAEKETDAGEFRSRSMAQAFTSIGLDPQVGIGKAIKVTFDGEPEQLAEFAASEFEYEYGGQEHPYARAIAQGQAALDQVGQTAGSIAPPTQADELAKAEAKGDHATTLAMKGAQLSALLERGRR